MEKFKSAVSKIASLIGNNRKPISIVAVVIVAIVVWLLHRDGIRPTASTGTITITTSSGEIISEVPEQTAMPEEKQHEDQ